MWIRRLVLQHFRNYRNQELDLSRGPTLFLGENAQGKSNLLEAVFLLATTRSERAQTDGELVHWDALDDPQPVARVEAQIERHDGSITIEVIVVARPRSAARDRVPASKRLRVNGVARRQADVVGKLTAVLFTTADLDLIGGAPAGRRRYLDVTLSQLDSAYWRALQRYGKVLAQRNALLRRIQDGDARPKELAFWDGELARYGATIVGERAVAAQALARHARAAHDQLSAGAEELAITYRPRLPDWQGARSPDGLAGDLEAALSAGRSRDIGAGMTLVGPHRDDLDFTLDGVAASAFASRGQQRTAALSLRLAEARFMAERQGDLPVVLLDDVLSELDEERRRAVLASLDEWDQLLITSADADRFGEGAIPSRVAAFRVRNGTVERAER